MGQPPPTAGGGRPASWGNVGGSAIVRRKNGVRIAERRHPPPDSWRRVKHPFGGPAGDTRAAMARAGKASTGHRQSAPDLRLKPRSSPRPPTVVSRTFPAFSPRSRSRPAPSVGPRKLASGAILALDFQEFRECVFRSEDLHDHTAFFLEVGEILSFAVVQVSGHLIIDADVDARQSPDSGRQASAIG